jgi:hypothetical protein
MPILPSNFVPDSARRGGVLAIPASAMNALPPWLIDAANALALGGWPAQREQQASAPPSPQPPLPATAPNVPMPQAANLFDRTRGAIPQGLADNADALLAFAGGTLRGGLGLGASEAAKIGTHAAQLAQQRHALAAQQAAALNALQTRGIPDAAALAMMNPALARVLLTRAPER